jgi:HAD superfamily hydrolase (TIGR01549 family)
MPNQKRGRISSMDSRFPARPIQLVTFDLYDTLIELAPQRWERLHNALRSMGIDADVETLRDADLIAEDFFTLENGRVPIRDRPPAEREQFRLRYMDVWLQAAGVPADEVTVRDARRRYLAEFETPAVEAGPQGGYRPFDDVLPALQRLREAGVKRAVISNADDDVTELCTHMAFAHEMNLIVTSAIVGYEKPDARTFEAAFEPLGVDPAHALHIGDQPKSDVAGALAVGMRAALIDRYHRHDASNHDVPVFTGLDQLVDHVLTVNDEAGALR